MRNIKKSSQKKDAKHTMSEDSFTYYNLKSSSNQISRRTLERVVKDPKLCVDSNLDILRKVDFKTPCEECITENQVLIVRRHIESKLIQNLQSKDSQDGPFFALNSEWSNNWSLFVNFADDDNRMVNKYLFDQFKTPETIKNKELLVKNDSNEDSFIFVVGPVMQALEQIYGCDQIIGRASQKLDSEKKQLEQDYLTEDDRKLIHQIKATTEAGYKVDYDELCRICTEENKRLKSLRRKIKSDAEYEDEEGDEEEGDHDELGRIDSSEANTQSNTNQLNDTGLDQSNSHLISEESNALNDRHLSGRHGPRETEMETIRSGI